MGRWDDPAIESPRHTDPTDKDTTTTKKRKHDHIPLQQDTSSFKPEVQPSATDRSIKSAANIALDEIAQFRMHLQHGEVAPQDFFKPSPTVSSSPEEDEHIRRELDITTDDHGRERKVERTSERCDNDTNTDKPPVATTTKATIGTVQTHHPLPPPPPPPPPATHQLDQHISISMLNECRSVEHYEKLNRISEGTYGVVYRAKEKSTGKIYALKKVKLEEEREGFPLTSIREINILLSLHHPNIVNVTEVVVGSSLDAVFLVMEYAEHDLRGIMNHRKKKSTTPLIRGGGSSGGGGSFVSGGSGSASFSTTIPFSPAEVKCLMLQLLNGIAYLHDNWVLHRDIKTSNILYTNKGELKLCDFGLARQYGSPLKPYSHMVVTLWYRAPELLLGETTYSTAIDVWSVGCVMGELLLNEALLQGRNELGQLEKIFGVVGRPDEEGWPGVTSLPVAKKFNFFGSSSNNNNKRKRGMLRDMFHVSHWHDSTTIHGTTGTITNNKPWLSEAGFDLLSSLLELCPERRITAREALHHPWFREHPLPQDLALMPTYPATNESNN
jgi:cell division cycle 2-like protein